MKPERIYRSAIAFLSWLSFMITFIPLAYTVLAIVVYTMAKSADNILKDKKTLENNKYIYASILYVLIFLYIWVFLWIHGLPILFEHSMFDN